MGRPWSIDPDFPSRARNFEMNLDDWEMYHSNPQEVLDAAVKDLNAQFYTFVNSNNDWRVVRDAMYTVMDKYIELGARDTEPETALIEALAIHFPNEEEEISRW